jgi:hypothetical protein
VIADAPATVVWIAPEPPSPAEEQALGRWARASGVTLTAPADRHPPHLAAHLEVAGIVEDLLDRARDAMAARDADAIDRATASAEALLRAHPALPQAAWLMAEVERARATRWRRVAPEDAEAGDRAWMRAQALDGGRVPGIGEVAGATGAPAATITLVFPAGDEARLDGVPVPASASAADRSAAPASTLAGPHDLVISADGAPVWAGWIEVDPGASRLEVDAPGLVPCSAADVARASSAGLQAAPAVACGSWVAVSRGAQPGSLRIARCGAGRCEAPVEWSESAAWARGTTSTATGSHDRSTGKSWPAWATWALAGAGVALAAGIAIAASGALEAAPSTTRFVTGGLKAQ